MNDVPHDSSARALGLERALLALTFGLSAAMLLRVVWLPTRPPWLDWPQHVAIVSALAHAHDAAYGFNAFVTPDWHLGTYLTFYTVACALTHVMTADAACRVVFSLGVVGTPLATAWLLKTLGRSPWYALLAFVSALSWPFAMGFIAYVSSVPLVLVGLGLIVRLGEVPTARRWWGWAALTTLLFFTHALAYLALMAIAMVAIVIPPGARRPRFGAFVVASAPSVVAWTVWVATDVLGFSRRTPGHGVVHYWGRPTDTWIQRSFSSPYAHERLRDLAKYFNEAFADRWDFAIACAWGAIVVGYALRAPGSPRDASPRRWVRAWLAVAPWVLYMVLPMFLGGVWGIYPRMLVFGASTVLLVLPDLPRRLGWRLTLQLPALALIVAVGWIHRAHARAWEVESRGFDTVVAATPRGVRIESLIDGRSHVYSFNPYLGWASWLMALRGGISSGAFLDNPTEPVRHVDVAAVPTPGGIGAWARDPWRYNLYGPFYDVALVRRGVPDPRVLPVQSREILAVDGEWSLFRNLGAAPRPARFSLREQMLDLEVSQRTQRAPRGCTPFRGGRFWCGRDWVAPSEEGLGDVHVTCLDVSVTPETTTRLHFRNAPAGDRLFGMFGVVSDPDERPDDLATLTIAIDGVTLASIRRPMHPGYQTFDIALHRDAALHTLDVDVDVHAATVRTVCFNATML